MFGEQTVEGIHFSFCQKQEWEDEDTVLQQRFIQARSTEGVHKFHAYIPVSPSALKVKVYSKLEDNEGAKITIKQGNVPLNDIRVFVTAVHDQKWWLTCVLQTVSDTYM